MSLSVIDKYIAKKEKDLLDYAKILESIITIDNNKMWKNKKEFGLLAKDVISIYADEYYFTNNEHRDNPIDYSNDNINHVLKAIITYCKEKNIYEKLKEWKNEIFLMSVIICTSCYVDFATNIVDGDFKDTKNKFKYLLSYLAKTKILHISKNKYFVKDLFDLVKKHNQEDIKFFESLKGNNYKNEYKMICENPILYKVDFTYEIEELKSYDNILVEKALNEYKGKFLEMSYELLTVNILWELISNREMGTYLIDVSKDLKKNSIFKMLTCNKLSKYIRIVVPWKDEMEYLSIINQYKKNGVKIIYDYKDTKHINSKIFGEDIELIVSKEFLKNNLDNEYEFKRKNIKLIADSKEEE